MLLLVLLNTYSLSLCDTGPKRTTKPLFIGPIPISDELPKAQFDLLHGKESEAERKSNAVRLALASFWQTAHPYRVAIAKFLQVGHVSPEMMKTYSHIRRQALNQAAAALQPHFQPTQPASEMVN
jgi:hypothetical protein